MWGMVLVREVRLFFIFYFLSLDYQAVYIVVRIYLIINSDFMFIILLVNLFALGLYCV